jgi:gliding motility-associated-like protein
VGEAISLDPNTGVVPRIFSPNGDGINDVVYFAVDNPRLAEVKGRVFDRSGAEVGDLAAPDQDTLSWDGRDRNGSVVPAGAYVYWIEGEGQVLSGWVVVAR